MSRRRQTKQGKTHAHSLNIQDLPGLHLTPQQKAVWKFTNVVALLAETGDYYDLLPPQAQDVTRAAKIVARKLQGE